MRFKVVVDYRNRKYPLELVLPEEQIRESIDMLLNRLFDLENSRIQRITIEPEQAA